VRIVAGTLKSRSVTVPRGARIRPTTSYIREVVFSIIGPDRIRGARFLDLFCGSGVVGLEAVSRGAAQATFVDNDHFTVAALAKLTASWGIADRAHVVMSDAAKFLGDEFRDFDPTLGLRYDFVYIDPPYYLGKPHKLAEAIGSTFAAIAESPSLFSENGLVFLEISAAALGMSGRKLSSGAKRARELERQAGKPIGPAYQHQFDDPWPNVYRSLGIPLEFRLVDWRVTGTTAILIMGTQAGQTVREII
jgi:16S rRNA (guanine(966)-N(2))-methyltransferase RsmD